MSIPSMLATALATSAPVTGTSSGSASRHFTSTAIAPAPSTADRATISQAARDRAAQEATAGGTYDFTGIRPSEVLGTINDLVKGGRMSLDESSALLSFVPPTELNAAKGKPGAKDQPLDVFAGLKNLIAYNQSIHNVSGVAYCQKALAAVERLQGTTCVQPGTRNGPLPSP